VRNLPGGLSLNFQPEAGVLRRTTSLSDTGKDLRPRY
jgi:hypothetical protein